MSASKRWEAKAHEVLRATKNTSEVEEICSLLPMEDVVTAIRLLKERPDLDMLFALYCRHQDLSKEQRADPDGLTIDFNAKEFWRNFRMPPGHGDSMGLELAAAAHRDHLRNCGRVPRGRLSCCISRSLPQLCKLALGSNALFVESLFDAVRDVRDRLQNVLSDAPGDEGRICCGRKGEYAETYDEQVLTRAASGVAKLKIGSLDCC